MGAGPASGPSGAPGGTGGGASASRVVRIVDPEGLHARPCAAVARAAQRFKCRVVLVHGGREADAKSVLGLLELGVLRASDVELRATGDDADACVAALAAVLAGTR